MTLRRIGWIALVVSLLLAGIAFPASAPAQRGLVTGLSAVDLYQTRDASVRAFWFDRTVDADAGIVRLLIQWAGLTPPGFAPQERPPDPTNPAFYNLISIDRAVRDATARGVQVMITVNTAPDWAEGPEQPATVAEGAWKPNPSDVADLMQALAARYTGSYDPDGAGPQPPLPAVKALQVWNEPNHERWLAPQFEGNQITGADRYREILNASYNAIKAVNPGVLVVTGGTSPYGDPPPGGPHAPGGMAARPVQWWEKLLCVQPAKSKKKGKKSKQVRYARAAGCAGKPLFDVFAHQPIDNTGKGPLQSGPSRYDASTPDLGRVVAVLRAAERLGTVSAGPHPVWATEFWWDSNPPNPVGVPLDVQARWIEQSLYLFWKAGADTAINFQIRDTTLYPDTRNGLQSGLYFLDGSPKPALTAFRFPFVTERLDQRTLRAWGKAPQAGRLRIQRLQGGRWKTVNKLGVGKSKVFVTKLRLRGKQRLRAKVRGSTSIVWIQSTLENRG